MAFTPLTEWPNYGSLRRTPNLGFPATIGAGDTWDSDLMPVGFAGVLAAVLMDQDGTLTINRYADLAGALLVSTINAAITADTGASVGAADGLPFASFNVTILNSGGADTTTLTIAILTGALL